MDLLFSIFLTVFAVYCFFLVGAQSPAPTATELGAAFWPRMILVAMIALLIANIVKSLKENKADSFKTLGEFKFTEFFKGKLFIGMVLVFIMALLMPYIGFMPVCFLFLMAYGALLGERRWLRLFLFSLGITFLLYVLFQGALSIMLARGSGVFREFALMCEGFLSF
ncbi:tripartite tricarboxylate transporter TctB family protein [Oscillospiraceae bacterium LTW-04]|nr:tripartite tricarboxylate transporter TctB family protein [Oscillospiraceae bacterium MB24-C1]